MRNGGWISGENFRGLLGSGMENGADRNNAAVVVRGGDGTKGHLAANVTSLNSWHARAHAVLAGGSAAVVYLSSNLPVEQFDHATAAENLSLLLQQV